MNRTYTLRYADLSDHMIRMLMIQCEDDEEALQRAASTMPSPYATLAISAENKLIWRGTREKVLEWVSSPRPMPSDGARFLGRRHV